MEIIFSKLYKIDISMSQADERPEYQNIDNFKKYIHSLLEQIGNKTPDRFYQFKSEYTEVRNLLSKILIENGCENSCKAIAQRLLGKEVEAQADLDKKKLGEKNIRRDAYRFFNQNDRRRQEIDYFESRLRRVYFRDDR